MSALKKRSQPPLVEPATVAGIFKWQVLAPALIILATIAWIFWPALRGDWLWDDNQLVRDNPLIHDRGGWWKIWIEPGRMIDFQPVTTTVFWIEWHFFGRDTLGYHLVNLLLHVTGAMLVWRLFARLEIRAAWLGGLLFAVHPVQVESVAWMAELKNVLSLPLFLLACLAWLDFDQTSSPRTYLQSLGWFLAALLAKATVVMFPCVLLLHAWWRRGSLNISDMRRAAPFFALAILVGAINLGFLHRNGAHQPQVTDLGGPLQRFGNAGSILGFYLAKFVWSPLPDPVYYQWPSSQGMLPGFLTWGGCLIACGLAWWRRATWGRHLLFGLGFFTVNLLPFLGFTGASYMAFTWAMDHILYLPLIGLAGLAAGVFSSLWDLRLAWLRIAVSTFAACSIVIFVFLSRLHARDFRSSFFLWQSASRDDPQSWLAREKQGEDYEARGWYDAALFSYQLAVALRPEDPLLHSNLAQFYDKSAQYPKARTEYDRALSLDTRCAIAYAGRGVLFSQAGRTAEAMADFRQALSIDPGYAEAHSNLGVGLAASGRLVEAMAQYQQAIELNPDYLQARANLGDALGETGHFAEALAEYREVLRIDPRNAEAHYNSGVALTQLGRMTEAISEYRASLRIKPGYASAQRNLEVLEKAPAGK